MKKLVATFLCLALLGQIKNVQAHDGGMMGAMVNVTAGYQTGYYHGSLGNPFLQAIDVNAAFWFVNTGFNHQTGVGSRVYVGGGLGTLLQVQYGFALQEKCHLLRFRADAPVHILVDIFNWELQPPPFFSSVGLYADVGLSKGYGWSVGVSFMFSIWDLKFMEKFYPY